MLASTLTWLNSNAPIVGALAACVSALTAIMIMFVSFATVGLNWRLARENRKLRKAETSPRVVAYLALNPRAFGAVDFVLKNIGKGPATNVRYKLVSGGGAFNSKNIRMLPSSLNYALLPQDDQLTSSMGMGWDLLAAPRLNPFEIELSFEDLTGSKHSTRFKLDVAQFDGMGRLGDTPDEQIADSLRKIVSVMEGCSHRRLQVEAMSVTERREHDQRFREMIEERRGNRGGASAAGPNDVPPPNPSQ